MPLSFATFDEIIARVRADVAAALPDTDPTLENSLLDAISTSFSSRISDVFADMSRLLNETFPQTGSGEFLDFHGEIFGVNRLLASTASGNLVVEGTIGTAVLAGTQFTNSTGDIYEATASVNVNTVSLTPTSITRVGTTATVTFAADHGFATGIDATVAGADQVEYNGTFTITVTALDKIEYTVAGAPTTPATGTISVASDIAVVPVQSKDTGVDKNLASGGKLTVSTPIVGLESVGFMDFNGAVGGADVEADESYRVRIIDERSSLEALFNENQIRQEARTVPGVTRVLVKEITPAVGQVTILFVRDDDAAIIPSPGEVAEVLAVILAIKPAHTDDADVIVKAPTPITTDFIFSAITPDTATMRSAIESNLSAFYRDDVTFEQTITEDRYKSVIFATIDPETGSTVSAFTLSAPVGDIGVTTDEIAVLGTVTFT